MENSVEILQAWAGDESGGSLVEYVMLASLIAVVCVGAVTLLGKGVRDKLEQPRKALTQ